MGKCISKHPSSSLTIATLSEQDLATAKPIASACIESRVELSPPTTAAAQCNTNAGQCKNSTGNGNQLCKCLCAPNSNNNNNNAASEAVDGDGGGITTNGTNQHWHLAEAQGINVTYDDCNSSAAEVAAADGRASGQLTKRNQALSEEHQVQKYMISNNSNVHVVEDSDEFHIVSVQQLRQLNAILRARQHEAGGGGGGSGKASLVFLALASEQSPWADARGADDGAGDANKGDRPHGCSADDEFILIIEEQCKGQSESKKFGKKDGVLETKGTAMSFGFRKKLNTTPKKLKKLIEGETKHRKQQDKCNNIRTTMTSSSETDGGSGSDGADTLTVIGERAAFRDDNGNAETMPKVYFEKMGAAAKHNGQHSQGSTAATTPSGAAAAAECTVNRFGFRGVLRPASAGTNIGSSKYPQDMTDDNFLNNNCGGGGGGGGGGDGDGAHVTAGKCSTTAGGTTTGLVSNLKRRSKSAHAGRSSGESDTSEASSSTNGAKATQPKSITFNLKQNSTIEYQRQQFFQQPPASTTPRAGSAQRQTQFINSGLHTNVIVRPMPRTPAVAYSKFTLHTVSLPKPEFPVAISLGVGTPGTPGSSYTPSPLAPVNVRGREGGQHPLTAVTQQQQQQQHHSMDPKTVKQLANNTTRRGFTGSREISADSGIASMDMALDSSHSSASSAASRRMRHDSPKRSRSRPRNLQMVMSGRHKFEVRDLCDDPPSSESNSFVEPLALPKLPSEDQTTPLPLSGLVRSNTVLIRDEHDPLKKQTELAAAPLKVNVKHELCVARTEVQRLASYEKASVEEEKLSKDRSASEKHSKTFTVAKAEDSSVSSRATSPSSSALSSWCQGVGDSESLAINDCSSLTLYSSEPSNSSLTKPMSDVEKKIAQLTLELDDEEISLVNTDMQTSTLSSFTESATAPKADLQAKEQKCVNSNLKQDRPKSFYNEEHLSESKFAEMALAGSTFLLDDETSPTDSLVSSTASDEMAVKLKKHKINEELQEKDIDEISPELEAISSPISHSFSLSDCGNLIDDEIADQPGLLCNQDPHDGLESSLTSRKDKTDTPTLMESEITLNTSLRSLKNPSRQRNALHQAIELSLRTPLSLRKAVMERAESLDTLSPCESICSDDLMMDFDLNSSMDSIDRSASIKSRSGSDLHKINIDDTELFSELENKGSDVMRELNTILRVHNNRKAAKESVIAKLPARATRLLNRSRLQQQQQPPPHQRTQQCPSMFSSAPGVVATVAAAAAAADSDSSRSPHSLRRSQASSRASSISVNNIAGNSRHRGHHHSNHLHQQHRDSYSSSDDLMLYDKSFRNAMIQDVLQFKKQLLRLRRILQEEEECSTRTETLNPFETDNGKLFATCGLDSKQLDDIDLASLTSSTTDDPVQELAELRRQVVYLQSQVDDRDRTIRLQRNLIEKLEAEKKALCTNGETPKECISMATQTERTRPLSVAAEGLSRSKPQYTSYTTHFPLNLIESTTVIQEQHHPEQQQLDNNNQNQKKTRRHTIISTTLTNYNHQVAANGTASSNGGTPRRASIAWENPKQQQSIPIYKPVRITLIGEPLKLLHADNADKATALHNGSGGGGGGDSGFVGDSAKMTNGNVGNSINGNLNHVFQQLDNNTNNRNLRKPSALQQQQQPQQQQQQQQHILLHSRNRAQSNGNLYPTVTIV